MTEGMGGSCTSSHAAPAGRELERWARWPMTVIHHRLAATPVPRLSLVQHAPLAVALGLRVASEGTANLGYILIAAYALLGREHAVRALALSWLFTLLSPGMAPDPSAAALLRFVVLGTAAASVAAHGLARSHKIYPFTLGTGLLGLFIVAHSLLFSPMPAVSILKAVSWTVVMATLLSAWLGLSPLRRQALAGELFWGLVAILVLSLPLLVLHLGYLRNGHGFQGILNHPQAFGPTMALLGAWAASRLFAEPRPPWRLVSVAGACLVLILMSESRTAGLAMVFGVGLAVVIARALAGRPIRRVAPGLRNRRVWTVFAATLVAGLTLAPLVQSEVQRYIAKSDRVEVSGLIDAYNDSRGGLMDAMLANIADKPMTGIGFGIASDAMSMTVQRDPILHLPISASIEKGVAPLAVLEELGIFGALAVAWWVYTLLRRAARNGLAPLAICITVLLLNMGESTFFSPSGLGLITLILLGWAYASGPAPGRSHG